MNLDQLNKWLTLLANTGVLVGLFVVILELRQNDESLNAQIHFSLGEAFQDISARATENTEFAQTLARLFGDQELEHYEMAQVLSWIQESMIVLFSAYELKEQGIISEETWGIRAKLFAGFFDNENFRVGYESNREFYPEDFFREIETYYETDDH